VTALWCPVASGRAVHRHQRPGVLDLLVLPVLWSRALPAGTTHDRARGAHHPAWRHPAVHRQRHLAAAAHRCRPARPGRYEPGGRPLASPPTNALTFCVARTVAIVSASTPAGSRGSSARRPGAATTTSSGRTNTTQSLPEAWSSSSPPCRPGIPPASQAIRITRRVRPLHRRRWHTVTVDAVTNLPTAGPRLADDVRGTGHRGVQHIRDPTFAQEAVQVRTGNAPPAMASLRHLALGILRTRLSTATSPPRCAATARYHPSPATPLASQAMKPTLRHFAEALAVPRRR
jgi:hypothetical protein